MDRYVFVADFNQKAPERKISTEYMWKYPLKPPPVKFDLDMNLDDMKKMVFQFKGAGHQAEVLNIGRVAYMNGDHDLAHTAWLQGRQEFKDESIEFEN